MSDWKSVGAKMAQVGLPLLGTLLGPAGTAAGGLAGNLIAALLGKDPNDITPDEMLSTIGNPEYLVKLKEIESNHELELRRLVIKTEELRLGDIAGAREREVKTTEATGRRDINLYLLAWTVVVLFFVLVGILMFVPLGENTGPVNQLFGAIAVGFGTVLQYFFGSSKSSNDKTALLANGNKPQAE